MKTRIAERGAFRICGYAVETDLENNDPDISKLYEKFEREGYDNTLKELPFCEEGYFGLEWYTEGHKSFFYLLGRAVGRTAEAPAGAEIRTIPAARYIVAEIPAGSDIVGAWTEFFYKTIPDLGCEVDAQHGYYFEYYRNELSGDCELWTPIRNSMKTPVIETERFILRPLTVEDSKAAFEGWAGDQEVARFMRWNLHKSIEETKDWLAGEEVAAMGGNVFNWGFVLKENQRLIGSGGLIYSQQHQLYEIGYVLARDYWGNGLTTEAAKRIVEYAKDELKLKKLFATHAIDNVASGKIIKKIGFTCQKDGTYSSFDGSRTFQSKEYVMDL